MTSRMGKIACLIGRHEREYFIAVRFCDDDVIGVAFQHRGSFALSTICCCGGNDAVHALRGKTVSAKSQRLVSLVVLVMGLLMVSPPAANAATSQLSGDARYDAIQCPPLPPGPYQEFNSYPGAAMTGSLQGCLYTKVVTAKQIRNGVYLETGEEVFFGSLDGGPIGTFTTTYKFESKWDPDAATGVEVRGRCQHPIAVGSGTGGFEGATGRLDFKDIVDLGIFVYRGHISIS